jgi:hypothetical protein
MIPRHIETGEQAAEFVARQEKDALAWFKQLPEAMMDSMMKEFMVQHLEDGGTIALGGAPDDSDEVRAFKKFVVDRYVAFVADLPF